MWEDRWWWACFSTISAQKWHKGVYMPRGWWGLGWERSRPLPDDGVLVCVELLALPATVMLLGKNLSVDSDADEGWFLQHTECREDILLWKLKPLTSIHRGLRVCPENYSGRVQYKLQPAGRSCKCSSFKSMIVTFFFFLEKLQRVVTNFSTWP